MIEIREFRGPELGAALEEVARLRIEVFREFPYLYAGDLDYEQAYLARYSLVSGAVIVLAMEGGRVVGASTGMPLSGADPEFQKPFLEGGEFPGDWFYLGESVVEIASRGQGIGHRFFDAREKHAARLGFGKMAFCAVMRPDHHPLKPAFYRSHEVFWMKRAYRRNDERTARLSWKQVDTSGEVENRLVFWERRLRGTEGAGDAGWFHGSGQDSLDPGDARGIHGR